MYVLENANEVLKSKLVDLNHAQLKKPIVSFKDENTYSIEISSLDSSLGGLRLC